MAKARLIEPDIEYIRRIQEVGGDSVKKCYQCATCSVACPLSPDDNPFPRKEMVWVQWGLKDRMLANPDIWLCYQCNDCSKMCPRGAYPGDVLAAARKVAFERFAVPEFLGKAVGNPNALLPLLLVPIALVFGIMQLGHQFNAWLPATAESLLGLDPHLLAHNSWFGRFFPLLAVDVVFVATTAVMAILAILGLVNFWRALKEAHPVEGRPRMDIIGCYVEAIKEILVHRRFTECGEASPRRLPHMLTLFGMLALFATTAFVFIFLYFGEPILGMEHFQTPLADSGSNAIETPIKILGTLGAIAFTVGLFMLWSNRSNEPETTGKGTYQDWLFLGVLATVAVSGLGSWLGRAFSLDPTATTPIAFGELQGDGLAQAAVVIYFVHLVSVWFLLAYLPFSKFAHMLYRTVALAYAFKVGRLAAPERSGEPFHHEHEEGEEDEDTKEETAEQPA